MKTPEDVIREVSIGKMVYVAAYDQRMIPEKDALEAIKRYHAQFQLTDEEIEQIFLGKAVSDTFYSHGFIDGAKWAREKLTQVNQAK